jgi:hypothetical protein
MRAKARAVKWLPSAMGMDPASPECDRFYQALVGLNLPLTHGRREGGPWGSLSELNNPLRFRRPLDQGASHYRSLRVAGKISTSIVAQWAACRDLSFSAPYG